MAHLWSSYRARRSLQYGCCMAKERRERSATGHVAFHPFDPHYHSLWKLYYYYYYSSQLPDPS